MSVSHSKQKKYDGNDTKYILLLLSISIKSLAFFILIFFPGISYIGYSDSSDNLFQRVIYYSFSLPIIFLSCIIIFSRVKKEPMKHFLIMVLTSFLGIIFMTISYPIFYWWELNTIVVYISISILLLFLVIIISSPPNSNRSNVFLIFFANSVAVIIPMLTLP